MTCEWCGVQLRYCSSCIEDWCPECDASHAGCAPAGVAETFDADELGLDPEEPYA